jgi:acyl-CoA thioester hydrolase
MAHWLLDPDTGRPWASAMAVTTVFDLESRKAVALTETELAAWAAASTPGLTI